MPVNNLDTLSNDDVPENRKEREDCRHRSFSVYCEKGHIVHLEAVREIANTNSVMIAVSSVSSPG